MIHYTVFEHQKMKSENARLTEEVRILNKQSDLMRTQYEEKEDGLKIQLQQQHQQVSPNSAIHIGC